MDTRVINCGLLNIQSVKQKTEVVRELIHEFSLDIFVLSETWLYSDDKGNRPIIKKMLPDTHTFHHVPRPQGDSSSAYGGVGIFLSKAFTSIRLKKSNTYNSFEYLDIDFNHGRDRLKFIVVYRPPSSSHRTFREEIQILLNSLVTDPRRVYICGDFNTWVEAPDDSNAQNLLELMDGANFKNNVDAPTARSGHTLDLVFSDKISGNARNTQVVPVNSKYFHMLVTFELDLVTKLKIKKNITFRHKANLRPDSLITEAIAKLDSEKFEDCVCNPDRQKAACCNCMSDCYNRALRNEYENMCPMVEKDIIVTDQEPWFDSNIKTARRRRRWFEKDWRRKRTVEARECYTQARNEVNRLIRKRKEEYYRSQAREKIGNMKELFVLFNDLLGKTREKVLPDHTPELAQNFADFFEEKIDNIYNGFNYQSTGTSFLPDFPYCKFSSFEPISFATYVRLAMDTKKTYSENDPLPIRDLTGASNINALLRIQLDIINTSLMEGTFPNSEKLALIKPTIKNNLDPQLLNSYRPVSNLSYLSKMIESAALQQLNEHLGKINVLPEMQSAYRKHHSTETALCSVVDDLLKSMDEGKCSIIILLDLSAAFDTVVHELLVDDLMAIGIEGTALEWFKSYLAGRNFQVSVNNTKSRCKPLTKGVPQGSVLGPTLFSIYMMELAWILDKYDINFQFYADDTQFYFTVANALNVQKLIDDIMVDVSCWMRKKHLKLNERKTECLLIGTTFNLRRHYDLNTILINGVHIPISSEIKDLGVTIDKNLSMHNQVQRVVKASNFQLRTIAQIKKYLDEDCLKMLVTSLVISRVDYCNSLYYNLPDYQLKKLQNVLNRAARLITGKTRWDRITPTLIELHWLPIKARIIFKICVLAYLARNVEEPRYLWKKLHRFDLPENAAQTRHALDVHRLDEPSATRNIGTRAFAHSAPRLFNSLPRNVKESENIVIFKKRLKTYLFNDCYDLSEKVITEQYVI